MARAVSYAVFIIPLVLSIIFGGSVLATVLQESGREFSMLPSNSISQSTKSIEILGLEQQYSTSTPVSITLKINNNLFDCGDVYVTIYEGTQKTKAVKQKGYFDQCFTTNNNIVPVGDTFSELVDTPGKYQLVIEILDKDQKQTISTSSQFTVR